MDSSTPQSDPAGTEYLFAYGTLQPGLAPAEVAHLVRRLEVIGKGFAAGTLYDLGSYLGAILDTNSNRRITGTVFRLPMTRNSCTRSTPMRSTFLKNDAPAFSSVACIPSRWTTANPPVLDLRIQRQPGWRAHHRQRNLSALARELLLPCRVRTTTRG